MPFIGTQPEVGGYSVLDNLTASATASYTLQKNSANFVPSSANQLLVSLNGVIQKPGSSFTISGSTLTFSSALTSNDSIDFIISMGEPLLVGTPSDGAVNTTQLATNAVSTAKIANDAVTGAKIENNPTIAGNFTVSGTSTLTGQTTATGGLLIGSSPVTALDDYEEGTWAPQLRGGGTNVGTTVHQGFYSKIGNVVHCEFNIQRNDSASNNNIMELTGLPFPHRTIPSTVGGAWIDNTSGDHKCFIYLPSDSSKIYFVKAGANDSYVNMNEYDNGRYIYAAFTYMTDS